MKQNEKVFYFLMTNNEVNGDIKHRRRLEVR